MSDAAGGSKRDGRATLTDIFTASRSGDLTTLELRLWLVVRSYESPVCRAATATLAHDMDVSVSAVEKARAKLVGEGWLELEHRGPKAPTLRAVVPQALHESADLEPEALHEDAELGGEAPHSSAEQAREALHESDEQGDEALQRSAEQGASSSPSSALECKQSTVVRKETTPTGKVPASPPPPPPGELDEPEPETNAGDIATSVSRLVGRWVGAQPSRPSDSEIRKQGAVAKRLVETHGPERVEAAAAGIVNLYPHTAGTPWDLFDLERKFSKAAAATGPPMPNGDRELAERVARLHEKDRREDVESELHIARRLVERLEAEGVSGPELDDARERLARAERTAEGLEAAV